VWGWGPNLGEGHLDPERAAVALDVLTPRLAVPVHWGTLAVAGLTRVPTGHGERMRALLHDPPHRFAAAAARRGGDSRVVIARPGQDIALDTPRIPLPRLAPPAPDAPRPPGTVGLPRVPLRTSGEEAARDEPRDRG
jgi:hypothetical protein